MSMSYDELKNKVLDRYGHIDSIPDSVYNAMKEYQKNGNAALDDDRVFNILKSEKEYSPVIESKEVSNDSIISKSPSLFETLMPRATSQTEKSPIQTLWSGAKDISSLPGRAVAEGVGLLGDVAGTITGSLNMPKEYRREYLDEELGNLVSTSRAEGLTPIPPLSLIYSFILSIAFDLQVEEGPCSPEYSSLSRFAIYFTAAGPIAPLGSIKDFSCIASLLGIAPIATRFETIASWFTDPSDFALATAAWYAPAKLSGAEIISEIDAL